MHMCVLFANTRRSATEFYQSKVHCGIFNVRMPLAQETFGTSSHPQVWPRSPSPKDG